MALAPIPAPLPPSPNEGATTASLTGPADRAASTIQRHRAAMASSGSESAMPPTGGQSTSARRPTVTFEQPSPIGSKRSRPLSTGGPNGGAVAQKFLLGPAAAEAGSTTTSGKPKPKPEGTATGKKKKKATAAASRPSRTYSTRPRNISIVQRLQLSSGKGPKEEAYDPATPPSKRPRIDAESSSRGRTHNLTTASTPSATYGPRAGAGAGSRQMLPVSHQTSPQQASSWNEILDPNSKSAAPGSPEMDMAGALKGLQALSSVANKKQGSGAGAKNAQAGGQAAASLADGASQGKTVPKGAGPVVIVQRGQAQAAAAGAGRRVIVVTSSGQFIVSSNSSHMPGVVS